MDTKSFEKNKIRKGCEIWEEFPFNLFPLSFQVDLALWLFTEKPTVRVILKNSLSLNMEKKIENLINSHQMLTYQDTLILAPTLEIAKKVLQVDLSPESHEENLGLLLGYPACCVRKISQLGEPKIDHFEKELCKKFKLSRKLLDTSQYVKGVSLISHVPCNSNCAPSSTKAGAFLERVRDIKGGSKFTPWRDKVLNYFRFS